MTETPFAQRRRSHALQKEITRQTPEPPAEAVVPDARQCPICGKPSASKRHIRTCKLE